MNWLFCGSVTSTRDMRPLEISRGLTTVNGTTRDGPSAFAAGFHAKPTFRPTESPVTPLLDDDFPLVRRERVLRVRRIRGEHVVTGRSPGRG